MLEFLSFYHMPIAIAIFILLLGSMCYKKLLKNASTDWGLRLKREEDVVKAKSSELEVLKKRENDILGEELEIIRLYEITKKMSESLRFDDSFKIFSAFLKENLVFRKTELFILKEVEDNFRVDKRYKVWKSEGEKDEEDIDCYRLIEIHLKEKKELFFKRGFDPSIFTDLKMNEDVHSFLSIPLLSEKKMVGILTIENLNEVERRRFAILSTQFALELKKVLLYETVEELAITDSLTNLYVRRYFLDRLDGELARSKRYKLKFAYLMTDIDDFKRINDTYGHLVGDVILSQTGRIIKESVREIDFVARYGGEEFSIFLPETDREGAKLVADRIRKRVEENIFKAYDEELRVTISVGISMYPDDAKEVRNLIEKADAALYAAKNAGKNLVCDYKKEYNNKFKSEEA